MTIILSKIIDFYLFLVTDILKEDKKNLTFDPIHMFTDKLGGVELPHPQI